MPHNWIYNSDPRIVKQMLEFLGLKDIDELFKDIPAEVKLSKQLNVGFGRFLSEFEIIRLLKEKKSRIQEYSIPPMCGIEMCYHYVPAVVKELISRGEFYTAYTPYQPEINQGILQALFEYQSVMAELYGVDVVNASMYDGSTALAEAVRMALRVTKRKKVIISETVSPIKRNVVASWLQGLNVKIDTVPWNSYGETDIQKLREVIDSNTAAVVVEMPNVFGIVEKDLRQIIDIAHEYKALAIVFANPLVLGLVKPPGELGADIVVGEGQPLGLGLYYGGSTVGILGTKRDSELIRQLPGRLVGMTLTMDKTDRGFALVLQTREQHIRRERATSNITTNSALMAIATLIYTVWLGGDGLKRLSLSIAARTRYALNRFIEKLKEFEDAGVLRVPLFKETHTYFMKIPIMIDRDIYSRIRHSLRRKGVLFGSYLGNHDPKMNNIITVCITEVHSKHDIDTAIEMFYQELALEVKHHGMASS